MVFRQHVGKVFSSRIQPRVSAPSKVALNQTAARSPSMSCCAVLEVADDQWKSLIKFGLYTGQRLADIAALTWTQVDLSRNEIRLTTRKTGKSS